MKCSILINDQNYFLPYVEWLIKNPKKLKFSITGVHAKDPIKLKEDIESIKKVDLYSSANEAISNSDLTVSLGYWKVLKKDQIAKSKKGIINFHHSYALKYKGRHCATWAIRNEEEVHGSTMHFIDENLDSGNIIDTDFFKIKETDTAEKIFLKANKIGLFLLKKNFEKIINNEAIKYKNHSKDFFCYKKSELNHEIDTLCLSDEKELLKQIRALTFKESPSPFIKIKGHKIFLKMSNYDSGVLQ